MDILNYSNNKTFNKKLFELDLQKTNLVENIKFKSQNNKNCHKNKNKELVIGLSTKLYVIQPKAIHLKRNFFMTLKKNYNNNLIYSSTLSKHLYKTRFIHLYNFMLFDKKIKTVAGRVLKPDLFKNFNVNIAFQGIQFPTTVFSLMPKVKRRSPIHKRIDFYINKLLNFNIYTEQSKNNFKKIKFSRKDYFLSLLNL